MSDPFQPQASGGGVNWKIPVLFGSVLALLGANVYLFTQLDAVRNEAVEYRKTTATEIANLKESSSVSVQTAKRSLSSLKDELEGARRQASMAAGQVKADATRHAEELAKRLQTETARVEKQQQQIKTDLTQQVGEVATKADAKIGAVNADLGTVKTDVASAKSEIEKTIADLKRTNGDLGVQSGLIATNGKELAALRALGERNYFEFNLTKSKEHKKIGDVSVLLKKTDPKKNKYTIELLADDKTVEKKDKNLNEPVQFYVAKARQPYEIVVNEVKKDQIIGYLTTPKVQAARN